MHIRTDRAPRPAPFTRCRSGRHRPWTGNSRVTPTRQLMPALAGEPRPRRITKCRATKDDSGRTAEQPSSSGSPGSCPWSRAGSGHARNSDARADDSAGLLVTSTHPSLQGGSAAWSWRHSAPHRSTVPSAPERKSRNIVYPGTNLILRATDPGGTGRPMKRGPWPSPKGFCHRPHYTSGRRIPHAVPTVGDVATRPA